MIDFIVVNAAISDAECQAYQAPKKVHSHSRARSFVLFVRSFVGWLVLVMVKSLTSCIGLPRATTTFRRPNCGTVLNRFCIRSKNFKRNCVLAICATTCSISSRRPSTACTKCSVRTLLLTFAFRSLRLLLTTCTHRLLSNNAPTRTRSMNNQHVPAVGILTIAATTLRQIEQRNETNKSTKRFAAVV